MCHSNQLVLRCLNFVLLVLEAPQKPQRKLGLFLSLMVEYSLFRKKNIIKKKVHPNCFIVHTVFSFLLPFTRIHKLALPTPLVILISPVGITP